MSSPLMVKEIATKTVMKIRPEEKVNNDTHCRQGRKPSDLCFNPRYKE
jgi:hypothetical protein